MVKYPSKGTKMPVIKPSGIMKSQKNIFYLFGEKETGLTKAFAYVLGENQKLLFTFLRSEERRVGKEW